jgi:hypothetical protein
MKLLNNTGFLSTTLQTLLFFLRPEWLQIHHVISKQTLRDGTIQYFVKWRDLPYVDCSWEDEDMDIPDFQVLFVYLTMSTETMKGPVMLKFKVNLKIISFHVHI